MYIYNVHVTLYVYHKLCFNPGRNNRVLNIAQNFGDGYASKVFDCNLGYTSTIILNGNYIFAAKSKVKIIYYNCVAIIRGTYIEIHHS